LVVAWKVGGFVRAVVDVGLGLEMGMIDWIGFLEFV
jgi:hypothetical protein